MNCFAWQDLIALTGAFFGACQSSRIMPNFPTQVFMARFANGLHISVVVAAFGTMTTATNLMDEVGWVQSKLGFYIPLIAYAVIVLMGMTLLASTMLQTLISRLNEKAKTLITVCFIMVSIDLLILIHMMSIF